MDYSYSRLSRSLCFCSVGPATSAGGHSDFWLLTGHKEIIC
jgi:hypothetical protein